MTTPTAPAEPGRLNLEIPQGRRLRIPIAWKPGGVMADLTSYTAFLQVKATYDDAVPLIDLSTANGHIEVFDDSGTYNILITMADWETAALEDWGRGVWDLKLTPPAADSWPLLFGTAILQRSVTP